MDLRARLDRILEIRGQTPNFGVRNSVSVPKFPLADFLGGRWKQRPPGQVLVVEREFAGSYLHGDLPLEALYSTEPGLVCQLAGDHAFAQFHPEKTLFLDTETTGLVGGAGTYVFLVGVGYFHRKSFLTHQFFLSDPQSEKAFLQELSAILCRGPQGAKHSYLVSFNGKSYDLNLLSDRFILQRLENPFQHLNHLDLLYPSRLLWRGCFEDCRLQTLEQRILGVHRHEDISSSLIPRTYFHYLRSGQYHSFRQVFEHNRLDLLTMVTLLAQAGRVLREPDGRFVDPLVAAHLYTLRGEHIQAAVLLETSSRQEKWQAQKMDLLFQLARLKKKLGKTEEALSLSLEVINQHPCPPLEAFEEAAKILEHQKRSFKSALGIVCRGLELYHDSTALQRRRFRLQCRIAGKKWY